MALSRDGIHDVPDRTHDPGRAVGDVGHDAGGEGHDRIDRRTEIVGHVAAPGERPYKEEHDDGDDDDLDFCIHI